MVIVHCILCHRFSAVFNDHAIVRIDVVIILAVILVVGWGNKQRIEVDDLHPQILQVIQLVPHALQVTAVETAYIHRRRVSAPVRNPVYRTPNVDILTLCHIIALVSIAEAVHKDLVHDCALRPLRRMESRGDAECVAALDVHGSS